MRKFLQIHDIHDVMFSLIDTLNQNIWQPLLVAENLYAQCFPSKDPRKIFQNVNTEGATLQNDSKPLLFYFFKVCFKSMWTVFSASIETRLNGKC